MLVLQNTCRVGWGHQRPQSGHIQCQAGKTGHSEVISKRPFLVYPPFTVHESWARYSDRHSIYFWGQLRSQGAREVEHLTLWCDAYTVAGFRIQWGSMLGENESNIARYQKCSHPPCSIGFTVASRRTRLRDWRNKTLVTHPETWLAHRGLPPLLSLFMFSIPCVYILFLSFDKNIFNDAYWV